MCQRFQCVSVSEVPLFHWGGGGGGGGGGHRIILGGNHRLKHYTSRLLDSPLGINPDETEKGTEY